MDGWKDYFVDVVVHGKGHRKMCDENHEENGPHPPPLPQKGAFIKSNFFFVLCVWMVIEFQPLCTKPFYMSSFGAIQRTPHQT